GMPLWDAVVGCRRGRLLGRLVPAHHIGAEVARRGTRTRSIPLRGAARRGPSGRRAHAVRPGVGGGGHDGRVTVVLVPQPAGTVRVVRSPTDAEPAQAATAPSPPAGPAGSRAALADGGRDVPVAGLPNVVRQLEGAQAPRWTWDDTNRWYPALL